LIRAPSVHSLLDGLVAAADLVAVLDFAGALGVQASDEQGR
jgi:hypothetical protein